MNYNITSDDISRDEWEDSVKEFSDYNLYQTWAYQTVRAEADKQDISRFIIRDSNDKITSMGNIRIKTIKLLGLRIGYIQWGPLVRKDDQSPACFESTLQLLRDTYLSKKVDILRLVPNVEADEAGEQISQVLVNNGFYKVKHMRPYYTMMFPLEISEEDMLATFSRRWRRDLRKAERNNITIVEGNDNKYMDMLDAFCKQAQERKHYQGLDIDLYKKIQNLLPDDQKMHFIIAYHNDEPVTIDLTSNLGETAVGLFQASNENAMQCQSTYLVWWQALLASKKAGMKRYDLGGIDPQNNPTVYQFKKRMGARESSYIGGFEATASFWGRKKWQVAEKTYQLLRKH